MNKLLTLVIILMTLSSCSKKRMPLVQEEVETPKDVREHDFIEPEDYDIIRNNSAFSFNLYHQLDKRGDNVLMSPFSISSALAMTYAGSKNNTEVQMSEVLLFSRYKEQVHYGFKELLRDMEGHQSEGIKLNIANSLWAQENYPFLENYLTILKKNYGSEMFFTDFKSNTEKARTDINHWVEKKTEDKIKDLIQLGMLNPSTKLVLVNAIYFNAAWQTPFDENYSFDDDFFPTKITTTKARYMMHDNITLRYYENNDVQILELPYKDNRFSMIVLLPSKEIDIAYFEKMFTYSNYEKWLSEAAFQRVKVYLPKFSFTYDMELSGNLKGMGMTDAFGDEADFSDMTGKKDLKIDKVVHKAFIDVSERGTEAAAATAVIMVETTAPYLPEEVSVFKADRPFIFMIRNNENQSILFVGRLMKTSL